LPAPLPRLELSQEIFSRRVERDWIRVDRELNLAPDIADADLADLGRRSGRPAELVTSEMELLLEFIQADDERRKAQRADRVTRGASADLPADPADDQAKILSGKAGLLEFEPGALSIEAQRDLEACRLAVSRMELVDRAHGSSSTFESVWRIFSAISSQPVSIKSGLNFTPQNGQ
jgi:hypothetical protein